MIMIDGSYGEGGGQILRTTLGLSMLTGKPFTIDRIRAGRRKPGLLRQHLTAVKAAARISGAKTDGVELGSKKFSFKPGKVKGGEYRFAVGTAGSGTLVLQAVLPALITADEPTVLTIEGGTHNPYAPPYCFLEKVFLPQLERMGCQVKTEIEHYGFYPAGGGKFRVAITPSAKLKGLYLLERGGVKTKHVHGIVSEIPESIAQKEVSMIQELLSWPAESGSTEAVVSPGPGNAVMIEVDCENVAEMFIGFGEFNVPAKKVADNAAKQAKRYLASQAPVGRFLADQLLVPMAIAGKGVFRTLAPSMHTQTNIEVIKMFLDVDIRCEELERDLWEVEIKG